MLLEREKPRKRPAQAHPSPPISNQTEWLVGVPVKKRETSELKDSDALIPKTMSATPTTTNAIPNGLFIGFLIFCAWFRAGQQHSLAVVVPFRRNRH